MVVTAAGIVAAGRTNNIHKQTDARMPAAGMAKGPIGGKTNAGEITTQFGQIKVAQDPMRVLVEVSSLGRPALTSIGSPVTNIRKSMQSACLKVKTMATTPIMR